MSRILKTFPKTFSLLCVLLAALPLAHGCGLLATTDAAIIAAEDKAAASENRPDENHVVVSSSERKDGVAGYAKQFALMALFSKVSYRKDLGDADRSRLECAYLGAADIPPDFGMPRAKDRSGWERWKGTETAKGCVSHGGLYYETYVYRDAADKVTEAVVAYRGTENYARKEQLRDWSTNLSAALGLEPAEYRTARELFPALVAALKEKHPGIAIYVTGHSLGGGLAQQAAYLSRDVKAAFTFDPSPVTNWSYLEIHHLVDAPDPKIYRVYHWHEALSFVRNVTSRFNFRHLGRSDYEFFFQKSPPASAHEMGILACNFAKRFEGAEADHHYPREAVKALLENSNICPESVLNR